LLLFNTGLNIFFRGIGQPGRPPSLGPGCRVFKSPCPDHLVSNIMILIRRASKGSKDYTVIMLKGEEPKWILTSNYEHNRILEIFKQDKYYKGIENDFTDFKELFSKS